MENANKYYTDNRYFVIEDIYGEYVIGNVLETIKSYRAFHIYYKVIFEGNTEVLWFDDLEVLKINSKELEEKYMKKLKGFSKVAVVKQGSINYHFAIYDDGYSYEPGNKVIVSGDERIKVINEIITPEEAAERFKNNITAEVICPVDTSAYDERVNRRKAAEDLKKKMDDAIKKMDEEYKYEMYAEKNAYLKAMLDQYKELVG